MILCWELPLDGLPGDTPRWQDDPDQQEGDRERILELVRSLADESWRDHWLSERDLAPYYGSEKHVVHLRSGLRLVIVLDYDGKDGLAQVQSILPD